MAHSNSRVTAQAQVAVHVCASVWSVQLTLADTRAAHAAAASNMVDVGIVRVVTTPRGGTAACAKVPAHMRDDSISCKRERAMGAEFEGWRRQRTSVDAGQVAARRQGPRGVEPQRLRR